MIYTQDKLYTLKRDLPIGSFKCVFRIDEKNYEGLLVNEEGDLCLKSDRLCGGGRTVKPYKYSWILGYKYYEDGGISSITVFDSIMSLGEL